MNYSELYTLRIIKGSDVFRAEAWDILKDDSNTYVLTHRVSGQVLEVPASSVAYAVGTPPKVIPPKKGGKPNG